MGADPCARHIGQDRERRKADRIILPLVFLPHKKKDCVTQLPVPDIHLTAGRSFCRSGLGLPVVRWEPVNNVFRESPVSGRPDGNL